MTPAELQRQGTDRAQRQMLEALERFTVEALRGPCPHPGCPAPVRTATHLVAPLAPLHLRLALSCDAGHSWTHSHRITLTP